MCLQLVGRSEPVFPLYCQPSHQQFCSFIADNLLILSFALLKIWHVLQDPKACACLSYIWVRWTWNVHWQHLTTLTKFRKRYIFLTEFDQTFIVIPRWGSILLRGATRDVLNEIERNLQDRLCISCVWLNQNVAFCETILPNLHASAPSLFLLHGFMMFRGKCPHWEVHFASQNWIDQIADQDAFGVARNILLEPQSLPVAFGCLALLTCCPHWLSCNASGVATCDWWCLCCCPTSVPHKESAEINLSHGARVHWLI